MKLSERYLMDLRAIARTDPEYRGRTVGRMLGVGSDIAYRNRVLYDAWRLLRNEWSEDLEWELTGLRDLPTDQPLPDEVPAELRERIARALEEAIRETPASFAQLQAQRPNPADTGAYMAWYYRYAPYLTLGLPATESGLAQAWERLQWFMQALPEDEEILRDAVLSYGRRSVLDWYEARAATE